MAFMVPDYIDEFTRRRNEAKLCVWTELRDQLPMDHTVFTVTGAPLAGPVDFVILGPGGLVFMAVEGGIVDVVAPPQTGVEWTHRGPDGYFIGAIRPDRLSEGAEAITRHLLGALPGAVQQDLGCGQLHVFPDTLANHAPGIDLASPQRQVLVASDLGRIADWVERAALAQPASPELSPDLMARMGQTLTALVRDIAPRPSGLVAGLPRRHALLVLAAVAAALFLAMGLFAPSSPPESKAGTARPSAIALPNFVPAGAEWAVLGAMEVAGETPGRPVKWRHAETSGTVTLLPGEGGKCRTYRIKQGQPDPGISADHRVCL